jgi:hypothetical protein
MNQQRLNAYLNLIQGLLTCPSGEEWILLRQHEDLVNPELVQVMEQVANQLMTQGDIQSAKFLHNWAGKLHHILTKAVHPPTSEDKSQAYLKLIQSLIDSPKSSKEEILDANRDLIGPGLFQMMKQVATQAAIQGDIETASFLENLAAELSRVWLQTHQFQPIANKQQDTVLKTPTQVWSNQEEQELQAKQEANPVGVMPVATLEKTVPPAQIETNLNGNIITQLAAIAESLSKLSEILAQRDKLQNPLWYLDTLERAHTSNWILTTEEVEQLIGAKPECHKGENSYQRGCWNFIKVGKIGSQIGWRVMKEKVDLASNETD